MRRHTEVHKRPERDRDDNCHWKEELYAHIKVKTAFFYVDDRMVASTDPGWLQTMFAMITGLFDRVGLRTNVRKKVGMV